MPQRDLLMPWLTVLDNTIIGLEVAGVERRRPGELSGGYASRPPYCRPSWAVTR
jgi:NitT/TauT family transport system ATP-binding protein